MAYRRRSFRKRSYARRNPAWKKKRNWARKTSWRKKRWAKKSNPYTRSLTTVPDRMFMKMNYAGMRQATFPEAMVDTMTSIGYFQSSGVIPEVAPGFGPTTVHQPYYFDELQKIYRRCRVTGIKYRVEFHNINETEGSWNVGCEALSAPYDGSGGYPDVSTLMERRDGRLLMGGLPYGPNEKRILKGYFSPARALGITQTEFRKDKNTSGLTADGSATPSRMGYLQFFVNAPALATIAWNFKTTYYIEFFDRIEAHRSTNDLTSVVETPPVVEPPVVEPPVAEEVVG